MDAILEKLKEYLAMDEEIDFTEFQEYYQKVIDFLAKYYQKQEEEDLLRFRYVLNTIRANAEARAEQKDANMKKYRKMADKCKFWVKAIRLQLYEKYEYDQEKLHAADVRIDEMMRPQAYEE